MSLIHLYKCELITQLVNTNTLTVDPFTLSDIEELARNSLPVVAASTPC